MYYPKLLMKRETGSQRQQRRASGVDSVSGCTLQAYMQL
jgi:hypothetical protein